MKSMLTNAKGDEQMPDIKQNPGVLAIGWDVGGWMGKNHGVAACFWDKQSDSLVWIGTPKKLSIPRGSYISIDHILSELTEKSENVYANELFQNGESSVIIGADAPLGVPVAFHNLIDVNANQTETRELMEKQQLQLINRPAKEIENPFAYRYTDRFIYSKFNKKPLSAVFDRLGNNCTAAIGHALKWQHDYGFQINPIHTRGNACKIGSRQIIEVYPALVSEQLQSFLNEFLPKHYKFADWDRQHDFDAAICAIMAACHGAGNFSKKLPELVPPPEDISEVDTEGWIYYIP